MPDLTREDVERRLAPGFGFGWMSSGEQEALQTALSLYARAETAEQELDDIFEDYEAARKRANKAEQELAALRSRVAELEGENERLRGVLAEIACCKSYPNMCESQCGGVWCEQRIAAAALADLEAGE